MHIIVPPGKGRRTRKKIRYVVLLCTLAFIWKLFWPDNYNVPQIQPRAGLQHWHLHTGSDIAYNLIAAKGAHKQYPVIYLHGGPGGPITNKSIERLAPLGEDGYDVYLYDPVGGGFSSRLKNIRDYTAPRHVEDLEAIVQQIGASKVILIGQSWGAILATLFAAAHPGQVDRIIFTSPGPIQPTNNSLSTIAGPDSLHLRAPLYSNAQANKEANTLRTGLVANCARRFGWKLASNKEMDDFYTKLAGLTNRSTVCDTANAPAAEGGGGYYVQVMTVESFNQTKDPRAVLRNSTFPILVLKGECDNQHWGYTREYLDVFPVHKLVVVPNAGHSISVEQPAAYIQAIRDFLK